MAIRSSVPWGILMNGPGMSGALPDSANASTVIGAWVAEKRQGLRLASRLTVSTPSRSFPARATFAFGCTSGSFARRGAFGAVMATISVTAAAARATAWMLIVVLRAMIDLRVVAGKGGTSSCELQQRVRG